MSMPKALIMAGGTGGHIMPGLAVAHELQAQGWQVKWLGNPSKMEGKLVPKAGIDLVPLHFAGVRGKGVATLVKLPFTLVKACLQARSAIRQAQPDMVLGMGGYVASPLFHIKMTLFVVAALLSFKRTFVFRRWKKTLDATGQLPAPEEVKQTRKWVMWQGHLIPVIAVIAIFWARGM